MDDDNMAGNENFGMAPPSSIGAHADSQMPS
jgi:hypothetical protein